MAKQDCPLLNSINRIHKLVEKGEATSSDLTTLWGAIQEHAYITHERAFNDKDKRSNLTRFTEWAKPLVDQFGNRVFGRLRDTWKAMENLRKIRYNQKKETLGNAMLGEVNETAAAIKDFNIDKQGKQIADSIVTSKYWTAGEIKELQGVLIDTKKRFGLTLPEHLMEELDNSNGTNIFSGILQKFKNQEFAQKTEADRYKKSFNEATKGIDLKRLMVYSVVKNAEANQQQNVITMLKDVDKVNVDVMENISAKELKAYDQVQELYRDMYRNINTARVHLGREALPLNMDYVTFMRVSDSLINDNSNILEATTNSIMKHFAYENPRMFESSVPAQFKKKYLKDAHFKFEERKESIKAIDLDMAKVMGSYIESATRFVHMAPVKQMMGDLLGKWTYVEHGEKDGKPTTQLKEFQLKDQVENTHEVLMEWSNFVVTGKKKDWLGGVKAPWKIPTKLTDKFGLPPLSGDIYYEKIVSGLSRNIAQYTLTYSLRSIAVQPLANILTYTAVGRKSMFRGVQQYFNKEAREFAIKSSKHLSVRNADVLLEDMPEGATGKNVLKWYWNNGFKALQALDQTTATMGWLAAYDAMVTQEGMNPNADATFEAADRIVRMTHVAASNVFRAPIQRHTTGKAMTLFQTFNIGEFNYVLRQILTKKNMRGLAGQKLTREEAKTIQRQRIIRLIIGTMVANVVFEELLGLDSPLPSPVRSFAESMGNDEGLLKAFWSSTREVGSSIPIFGGGVQFGSGAGGAVGDYYRDIMTLAADKKGPKRSSAELLAKGMGLRGGNQFRKMYKYGWPTNSDKPLPLSTMEWMLGVHDAHRRLLIETLVNSD